MAENNKDVFSAFLGMVNNLGSSYINKKFQNDTSSTTKIPSQTLTTPITTADKEGYKVQLSPVQIGGLIVVGLLAVVLVARLLKK